MSPAGAAKPVRSAAEWRAQWECRLSGLPDLDQRDEAVQNETLHWLDWYFAQFHFDGMRVDAMGHVDPVRGPGSRREPSFCCLASAFSGLACGRHVACESSVAPCFMIPIICFSCFPALFVCPLPHMPWGERHR